MHEQEDLVTQLRTYKKPVKEETLSNAFDTLLMLILLPAAFICMIGNSLKEQFHKEVAYFKRNWSKPLPEGENVKDNLIRTAFFIVCLPISFFLYGTEMDTKDLREGIQEMNF